MAKKKFVHVKWVLTMEGDIPYNSDYYPGLTHEQAVAKEKYAEKGEVLEFFGDGDFEMKITAKAIEKEVEDASSDV